MLATDDDDDGVVVVMPDDDDEYRATEISTQLINPYHIDQKENNITNAKYDESNVTVENLIETDVNKLLCGGGNGKLNFPKANKINGKHYEAKVISKEFPLKYENQNVHKRAQELPEYKCLQQLHADICALKTSCAYPAAASIGDFRKFPTSQRVHMQQYRRYTFPCILYEEDTVFNDMKPVQTLECSVKLSNNDVLYHQQELSFPNENLKNDQFKESTTKERFLKKFPVNLLIQNVNKVPPQLTEFKCLAQLHTCALRSNFAKSSTASTVDLLKFPSTQRIHMPNRRNTFPCTLWEEHDLFNDMKSIGPLCERPREFNFPCENSFQSESKSSLQHFPLKILNKNISNNNLKLGEVKSQQLLHADICSFKATPTIAPAAAPLFIEPKEYVEAIEPFNVKKENSQKKKVVTLKKSVHKNSTENSRTHSKILNKNTNNKRSKQVHADICSLKATPSIATANSNKIQHNFLNVSGNLSKFPYVKNYHKLNRRRSFPNSMEIEDDFLNAKEFATTATCAVKFPIYDLCSMRDNKATFLNPLKNSTNIFNQTSYNKSNLYIADLTDFRNKTTPVVDTFGGKLLRHSSFPCISMKVTNNLLKSAMFPIQMPNNISLDPVAIPSHCGYTSRTTSPAAYQNQNCDRTREIQVQLNQEHLEETAENTKMFESSNYYLEQEQHINDAINLARTAAAKNTTESSSSSQINDGDDHNDDDERNNSVCVGGESTNMLTSTGGAQMNNNSHDNENNEPNNSDTVTIPSTPPTLENFELLDSYTTNCTIESAANLHHILSTSTPCSDVRDSSSQEVPSPPLNVNVNCSERRLTTETRPLLSAEEIAEATSKNLVTLPKYCLNNTEVDENLIENTRIALLSVRRAPINVQNILQQKTEIAKNIDEAMTLTEIEDSGVLSEFSSILDDNLNKHQQDLVSIEELQSNEMKLEMKSARGSILSTNAETPARRYTTSTQLKNEQNLTSGAHRPTLNSTYGTDIGKSSTGGSALTRNREIPTRHYPTTLAESVPASNAQRRHSLTGNSAIGHKLQKGNDIATVPATERSTFRGAALSGSTHTSSAATMTNTPRRTSLTGTGTSRAGDTLETDRTTLRGSTLTGIAPSLITSTTTTNYPRRSSLTDKTNNAFIADRTVLRGSTLSGTAPTLIAPTTINSHRRSSLTGSMPKANDSLVDATVVGSNSTNTEPKKYRRAPTKYVPSQETNDVTRSVSLDTVDSVLPARTLLRRQRRMRPQGSSYDEPPESTIERLNRLRARISGALSEVKGVLKHYSTDAEDAVDGEVETSSALKIPTTMKTFTAPEQEVPENVVKKPTEEITTALEQQEPTKKEDGPVSFRFKRVVRRRSLFDEEDEDKEKEKQTEVAVDAEINKLNDEKTRPTQAIEKITQVSRHDIESSNKISSENDRKMEIPTDLANKSNAAEETGISKVENNVGLYGKLPKDKYDELLSDKFEYKADVENVEQNLLKTVQDHISSKQSSDSIETKDLVAATMPTMVPEIITKLKKKVSTTETADGHTKRTKRRASIAAVEGSQIEPPIKTLIPLDIKKQRRPSDSEAILKKKIVKVKTIVASEADGETAAPKVKLINKVKRPSLKRANIATQVTTANAMTDDTKSTPASIIQNNSSVSVEMQANNSNKDALKTALAAATLATQLVIDDASLTISQATVANAANSKATKESTVATDSFVTSDNIQAIVGTLVSPLRASEQSSQLKKPATETQKLAEELVAEIPIIIVDTKTSLEEKINQSKTGEVSVKTVSEESQDLKKDLLATEPNKIRGAQTSGEKNEISVERSVLNESKKPINKKVTVLDTINEQVRRTTPENQQVSADILKAPALIAAVVANDIAAESSSTESIRGALTTTSTDAPLLSPPSIEGTTKAKASTATTHSSVATGESEASAEVTMPELQVKAAQVFIEPKELLEAKEPFNVTKESSQKKKVILKKLVRKNSTEKSQANNKIDHHVKPLTVTIKDKSKKDITFAEPTKKAQDVQKLGDIIKEDNETIVGIAPIDEEIPTTAELEVQNEEEAVEEPPAPEKKKRKIKKKVIIKRQQRRLSISESTFFKTSEEEPTSPIEDTLEKPVEYVKVASDEEQDYEEIPIPTKPNKSCLKVREFHVGDLVMYAERFKKTQVRWKRGKVLERITSISYKLEIEGKEVPAHISYIKKYTGRKVNFGGKEYLEIDYEQVAEEEEKARNYSIWNMV